MNIYFQHKQQIVQVPGSCIWYIKETYASNIVSIPKNVNNFDQ